MGALIYYIEDATVYSRILGICLFRNLSVAAVSTRCPHCKLLVTTESSILEPATFSSSTFNPVLTPPFVFCSTIYRPIIKAQTIMQNFRHLTDYSKKYSTTLAQAIMLLREEGMTIMCGSPGRKAMPTICRGGPKLGVATVIAGGGDGTINESSTGVDSV